MSDIIPFDHTLVTQSVNFHGHNLLKQLVSENAAQIHTIKLQDIDYKVYQNRTAEMRDLGYRRVQEMIGFIASKSDALLVSQPKWINSTDQDDESYKERYKHQLPIEVFMHVDKSVRISELIKTIKEGDILFTEVYNYLDTSCALLKLLAFDGGKHRYFLDFRATDLKVILRNEDTLVSKPDEDKLGRWMIGTRLRVEVISVFSCSLTPNILVGTKGTTLTGRTKNNVKLGKVQLSDLPPVLSNTLDPGLKFLSQCIEKMESYKNPHSIKQIAPQMKIELHSYPSLMSSLRGIYSESEKANTLRKAQMCKWAHKSVADGVTHFKKGQHEEAFQCLNKALQIDPENVEAFVAKGALLANLGRYEKAIEDFEKALKYNPSHTNARKYMCETMVELGKQLEEKDKLKEAEKCYSRCLELDKDHIVAKEALNAVSSKLGTESNFLKLLNQDTIKKEEDFLSDLLQMESELNKKRSEEEVHYFPQKDEENNPISVEEPLKKDENEKEDSLSPLSQKLAMQQNLWAPPSEINTTTSLLLSSGIDVPPLHPMQDPNLSIFSNPPPNWPVPDITKPPPSAFEYSEDPSYKARVEQFLKELERRSFGSNKKQMKSRDGSQSQKSGHKDGRKRRKRRESSSSSSSDSSRSSGSSSSSSSTNSSSSTSSASSENRKNSRKAKRHSKKKTKKNKKASIKRREKKLEENMTEMTMPDFKDLEEKLLAYYKKMEAINTQEHAKSRDKTKKGLSSGKVESKKRGLERTEAVKRDKILANKLKLTTHPVFLENDSEEEEKANSTKEAKRPPKKVARSVGKDKPSKSEAKKKKSSSFSSSVSSSSSSKSRSRSRSHSSWSTRSRSRSRDKHSRSTSSRYKHQYSRSRSKSRGKHHQGTKSRSKSRSRPHHRKSKSKEGHNKGRPKSKSPPFGYYRNKPYYSFKDRGRGRGVYKPRDEPSSAPKPPPPPVKFEIKKKVSVKTVTVVEEAKKNIEKHLASNARDFNSQMMMMKKKKEENVKEEKRETEGKPSPFPDPSARFGKWANEIDPSKENEAKQSPLKPSVPTGSLDQFENFLKKAKEKSIEMMKERNKAFLKPKLD